MKKILGVALMGVLAAVPGVSAQQTMCGGSGTTLTCVMTQFTLSNSGNTLNMFAFNGPTTASSGVTSVITGFVVALPGSALTGTLSTANFVNGGSSSAMTGWVGTGNPGGQFIGVDAEALQSGSSGVSTCAGPFSTGGQTRYSTCDRPSPTPWGSDWDYALFSWTLTGGPMTTTQLAQIEWGWKAQAVGVNGISIECGTSLAIAKSTDKLCGGDPDDPTEIVPEPATMTLLATGLVGLAASSRRRRKQG